MWTIICSGITCQFFLNHPLPETFVQFSSADNSAQGRANTDASEPRGQRLSQTDLYDRQLISSHSKISTVVDVRWGPALSLEQSSAIHGVCIIL
jgi:hypothetical protein